MRLRSRLEWLDLARGLTIASMLVVNNPGEAARTHPQLRHAAWNGFTFADVVFPVFVLLMGMSAGIGSPPNAVRVARRVGLLLLLGLVVNAALAWPVGWESLRLTGVLQRLALAYLVAALCVRLQLWAQLIVAGALMAAHAVVLLAVPVGGVAAGTLLPHTNASRAIDRLLISPSHLYAGPTDPEGLLGTLSAAAMAVLGAVTMIAIRRTRRELLVRLGLALMGLLAAAAALALSAALPVNKRLWTPSYALLTTGLGVALVAACRELARLRRTGAPKVMDAMGQNAITIYIGSEVLARPFHAAVWPRIDELAGAAHYAYPAFVVLLWAAVGVLMRARGWSLRL